jgi:hypothetical protein
LYRTRHEPSTTALASRCRHRHPRVANRYGADFASCSLGASSLLGCPAFSFRTLLMRALSALARAETTRLLRSLSLSEPPPVARRSTRRARTLSTRDAPNTTASQAPGHLPPIDPSGSLLAGAQSDLQTTCSTRVLPPWPAVRHAFTRSICVLGTPHAGSSPECDEPHAPYGLLQLKRSSNTPTSTPNLNFRQQATLC